MKWARRARMFLWGGVAAGVALAAWGTRLGTRWPSVYYMTGPSMEPTLAAEEYFIAWSPPGRLSRGDLVLFEYRESDDVFHVLRRLAALPGDTIGMDSGAIILNGEPQRWPFRVMAPNASRSELAIEGDIYDWGPWVVPTDSVVLLADTRDIVGWPDSRFIGFVAIEDVIARASRKLNGQTLR